MHCSLVRSLDKCSNGIFDLWIGISVPSPSPMRAHWTSETSCHRRHADTTRPTDIRACILRGSFVLSTLGTFARVSFVQQVRRLRCCQQDPPGHQGPRVRTFPCVSNGCGDGPDPPPSRSLPRGPPARFSDGSQPVPLLSSRFDPSFSSDRPREIPPMRPLLSPQPRFKKGM